MVLQILISDIFRLTGRTWVACGGAGCAPALVLQPRDHSSPAGYMKFVLRNCCPAGGGCSKFPRVHTQGWGPPGSVTITSPSAKACLVQTRWNHFTEYPNKSVFSVSCPKQDITMSTDFSGFFKPFLVCKVDNMKSSFLPLPSCSDCGLFHMVSFLQPFFHIGNNLYSFY